MKMFSKNPMQAHQSRTIAHETIQNKRYSGQALSIEDNRPESIAQKKLSSIISNSPDQIQRKAAMEEDEEPMGQEKTVQKQENHTGMPDELKTKMESSFNTNFSDVRVQPNSSKAPEVGALAFTQGSDVHFAPGQFRPESSAGQQLLGHELTHVVQQREERVQPTTEVGGMPVNDNPGLESEADSRGVKAAGQSTLTQSGPTRQNKFQEWTDSRNPVQGTFVDPLKEMENSAIRKALSEHGIDVSDNDLKQLRIDTYPVLGTIDALKKHLTSKMDVTFDEEEEYEGGDESEEEMDNSLKSKLKKKKSRFVNKMKSKTALRPQDKVFKKAISGSKYMDLTLKFHRPTVSGGTLSILQGGTGWTTGVFDLIPQRVKIKEFVPPSNERWARYVASSGLSATGGVPVVGMVSAPIGTFIAEHAKGKGVWKSLGKSVASLPGAAIDTVLGIVTFGGYSAVTIAASGVAAAHDVLETALSIDKNGKLCSQKISQHINELNAAYNVWKSTIDVKTGLVSGQHSLDQRCVERLEWLERQLVDIKERLPDVQQWIQEARIIVQKATRQLAKIKQLAQKLKKCANDRNEQYDEIAEDSESSEPEDEEQNNYENIPYASLPSESEDESSRD